MNRPATTFYTRFNIGERVKIDNCADLAAIVTCIELRRFDMVRYEVSWWHNSECKFCTFDDWRLSAA